MKMKITRTNLSSIESPTKGTLYLWDTELRGFGVRIGARDRTFIVKGRIAGKQVWVTLGGFPVMTPEAARKMALETMARIQQGINPNADCQDDSGASLKDALDRYLEARREHMTPRSAKSIRWHITHYLAPWLDKPLADITPDMVEIRHREIGAIGRRSANLTMRYFRSLFNAANVLYAKSGEDAPFGQNPTKRLTSMRTWYTETPKARTIPIDKVGTAINTLIERRRTAYDLTEATSADYLLFILFTGSRMNEAAGLAWENVDFKKRRFTFIQTKNKRDHTLPMSDVVEALLTLRHSNAQKSPWVFPGKGASGHIFDAKRLCGVLSKELEIPFSHHDLRRVFATVGKGVVEGDWVSVLLNHTLATVTGRHYFVPDVEDLREPLQRITNRMKQLAGLPTDPDLTRIGLLDKEGL